VRSDFGVSFPDSVRRLLCKFADSKQLTSSIQDAPPEQSGIERRRNRIDIMRHDPLTPGDNLRNRYTITRVHSLGGMSALYEARDDDGSASARRCAIKETIVQDTEDALASEQIDDFERVAGALLTLDHPAIPKTFDRFVEDDRTYLVTEFVEGKDLDTLLGEQRGRLPVRQVYDWGVELCEALNYLHLHEPEPIIFRDLKPANVMIDRQGHVRLVDFGIAVIYTPTRLYAPLGTDGYAAPEQYMGEAFPAIDIYGLGAMLHHLLSGSDPRLEPPFSFEKRSIRKANPDVPEALEAVVMRAVSHDSWDRFASMAEMLAALKDAGQALS
jgi:serine/threonine protein kinase